APEWTQCANIKFKFVDSGDKDIFISFDPSGGSYSYLGTDCIAVIARGESSMNLGWIDDNRDDDELRQVILHEFGHALGAVHEHESPMAKIPWNKKKVYEALGGPPNNWPPTVVDANMFNLYTLDETPATDFDGESIMLYYFPPEWTTNGKGTSFNTKLSNDDKAYTKFCYPGDDYDAGIFNTMEVRPWDKPQAKNEKTLYYYKKYNEVPQLPMGLTSMDIDQKANIRIKAYPSDANLKTFKVHIDSWADTVLYSASLTWLERSSRFDYVQTDTYNTQETRPWNQPQLNQSKRINFAKPFSRTPKVVTFLQSLDMDRSRNWRIRCYATDIDTNGFTIHADSWADSILYSAGVTWLAYPADQAGVASGRFNTMDVRPWNQPRAENSATVDFERSFGSKTPKVLMALDSLDYDCSKNLRLRLSTSQVTPTGITWHLQSWWGSVMYSSGAQFFAWA
ncbi:hypothetical protein S40285_09749, partial [Stachybotrys chlorohalonatus IBT 40285]